MAREVNVNHRHYNTAGSGFGAGFGGCLGVLAALFLVFVIAPIGCTIGAIALTPAPVESFERPSRSELYRQDAVRRARKQQREPVVESTPVVEVSQQAEIVPQRRYTLHQFKHIAKGMIYEEVVDIMGGDSGEIIDSTDWSRLYRWQNSDGSHCVVNVEVGEHGKVIGFAQRDLK